MGIPRPSSSPGQNEVNGVIKPTGHYKPNFSNDVLKVEISGANRSYFSILDLPGIFQSLTKDLTEVEKLGVRNLSANYMTSKQSVIMQVHHHSATLFKLTIKDASRVAPTMWQTRPYSTWHQKKTHRETGLWGSSPNATLPNTQTR